MSYLPHFAAGKITHGFGRGSKELGKELARMKYKGKISKFKILIIENVNNSLIKIITYVFSLICL
jgi:hypothetical protein